MVVTNQTEHILKIGSKGEIFPPKEVREMLGLTNNQTIILTIHQEKLVIRKLHSLNDILKKPAKVTISHHAWKEFRKKLAEDAEQ